MSRIACLRIPRFQIVVQQRFEPELKGKPFVLIGGRSRVLLCSPEAERKYVRVGMRLSEARAVCAELIWRDYDEHIYLKAQKEMLAELVACSPRVSSCQVGVFLIDADGLSLLGGENYFARNVLKFVSQKGYTECSIGMADSAFAAIVAAQNKKCRWHIVEHGQDRQFLSALSIEFLPIRSELKEIFYGLGIERMGQLTSLPLDEVASRFESEGLLAYNLASGIDTRQPSLPKIETEFQCYIDMGGPIEALNDTLFVIKSMLDRLTQMLVEKGLCAEEIVVCFYSDEDLFDERTVRLIRPSSQSKFLLEVLRLSIENKRLEKEFTSLRLIVSRTSIEVFKQMPVLSNDASGIIPSEENGVFSESFLLLVQKLNTRYGGDNVLVKPVPVDQYTPDRAGKWQPAISSRKEAEAQPRPTKGKRNSSKRELSVVSSERKQLAIAVDYVKEKTGTAGLVPGLVLKRHPSPIAVFMEVHKTKPQAFTYEGRLYRIQSITNPECLSGLWWEETVRKSYYTALVQPAASDLLLMMLLVYDHECQTWFIEGEYD